MDTTYHFSGTVKLDEPNAEKLDVEICKFLDSFSIQENQVAEVTAHVSVSVKDRVIYKLDKEREECNI